MLRASLLTALLAQARPRRQLLAELAAHGPSGARCLAYFSGRVALAALAASPRFVRRTVLLPEYLCNVVPMAFERSGWQVHGYPVDERFEPDGAALAAQAAAIGADALVLAPLYGADGGLAWWLGEDGRAARSRLGLVLVLDLCQDAARLQALPAAGCDWFALTSFNDKSFPGAMGAVAWTDLELPQPHPPTLRAAGLLALWVLRRLLPRRRPAAESTFEHSQATRFPYAFDVAGASRLQLALGCVGFRRLPRWQARRRAAVESGAVRPLPLPHAATAPFVVAAPQDPGCHRAKRPYALAHDASRSLRPRLLVRHNKGFDDR